MLYETPMWELSDYRYKYTTGKFGVCTLYWSGNLWLAGTLGKII